MERTFLQNTLFSVLYRVLNVIFPFAISIYTARILLADGIGKVAAAQNIVAYFTILAALGLPNYGIKAIAGKRDSYQRSKMFWELFCINLISTTVCLTAYYALICKSGYFKQERVLYLVSGLAVILNYVNVDWFYYGCEKFRYIVLRSFAVKIISFLFILLFVRKRSDYIIYALFTCLATAGNNIINIFNLKNMVRKISFRELELEQHLKPLFLLLLTGISVELYTLLDTTMLSVAYGSTVVGYYYNAGRLVKIVVTLLVSIGGALLPRLTFYYNQGKTKICKDLIESVLKVLVFLAVPCGIGLFEIAPDVIPFLYGNSYRNAVPTVQILSMLFFCLTFSNLFGTQILITVGKENKLFVSMLLGGIINVALNIFLIPLYQQNGAAAASVLSEFAVTVVTCHYAKKYLDFHIKYQFVLKCVGAGAVMGLSILIMNQFRLETWLQLALDIIVGGTVYILCNLTMHNITFIRKRK